MEQQAPPTNIEQCSTCGFKKDPIQHIQHVGLGDYCVKICDKCNYVDLIDEVHECWETDKCDYCGIIKFKSEDHDCDDPQL